VNRAPVALIVASLIGLSACGPDSLCGNKILAETLSPDGKMKAVLFTRDCGATTGYSTQISVIPQAKKLPNDGGNVFIIDGEPTITLRWGDDGLRVISGGVHKTAIKALTEIDGIRVAYE